MTDKPKRKGGFASMSPEKLREVSAKGGAAVPDDKRTFSRDRQIAQEAARKGAVVRNSKRGGGG